MSMTMPLTSSDFRGRSIMHERGHDPASSESASDRAASSADEDVLA
jgi:hypothetical protein